MAFRVLFVCSRNRLRSPTAERVFADWPGVETQSAGTADDAENPVTPELIGWADLIVVMEGVHRRRLAQRCGRHLAAARIVCLDVPDEYDYMDPALVALLRRRLPRFLPAAPAPG